MSALWKEFSKGLWNDLPPFKLVLGLCPTLAVTKTAYNGFGMGMAVIFVLALSNLLVSLLRKVIPAKVRIACFIVVAASLVVCVELLMQAYAYPLYQQLGIFVPLIVVNCIILGRAEAFASKNPILLSVADGLGHGHGLHHLPDLPRLHPRTDGHRPLVRHAGPGRLVPAGPVHGRGPGGLRLPGRAPGGHERLHQLAAPDQGA